MSHSITPPIENGKYPAPRSDSSSRRGYNRHAMTIGSHRLRGWITAKRAALLGVVLVDVLIALFLTQQIVTYRDYPFDSDEAIHANNGLRLALDLQAGNLGAFA